MKSIQKMWTSAIVALIVAVGCGDEKGVIGPDVEQPAGKRASKVALGDASAQRAVVTAKVTENETSVEGVQVAFFRSISGRRSDYRWKAVTDSDGEATIEIVTDRITSGYYRARVVDPESGEVMGEWQDVPINGGKEIHLSLPIGPPLVISRSPLLDIPGRSVEEHNKSVARRFFEELNQGNLAAMPEILSPNYVQNDPFFGLSSPGPEGFTQYILGFVNVFPDLQFTMTNLIADGDKVVYTWIGRGTHQGELLGVPATGKQVEVMGISFVRLVNGKFEEAHLEWDGEGLLAQLGVLTLPGRPMP